MTMPTTKFFYKLELTSLAALVLEVEYIYYPYCTGSHDEPPTEEDISIEHIKYLNLPISDVLWDLIINKVEKEAWKDLRKEQDDSIIARAECMKDADLEIFNLGK